MEPIEPPPLGATTDAEAQILVDALGRFAMAMMVTAHEQRENMNDEATAAFDLVILNWVTFAGEFLPVKEIAATLFDEAA
jgi:hypothetical protein